MQDPPQAQYFVRVDRIILNRVRSFTTQYDAWGRPKYKPSEIWWVSFWDRQRATVIPIGWIDRGWWSMSNVKTIASCTSGWLVESNEGLNVVAGELLVIDSPFDWEMRNRRIYMPIRKP